MSTNTMKPIAPELLTVQLHSLNIADAERVLIRQALAAAGRNRARAAELLGISVRALRNKLHVRGELPAEGSDQGD